MSNPRDYTVGWICAITTEYVAARAFLDEEHEGPEVVSAHDNNDYTLGKIGKHNVVIAVLPHGEYGTSSAASVARDMLHSFTNIRIGLMVGVGGGAPSTRHDIRLGDVVVSASGNGKGGVFQYDFGKAIQDREFEEKGFLNQAPSILRTAVSGLMAQYEGEGHRLEESIEDIFKKKPRLRKKYGRPEESTDRLYQPGVLHPTNEESSCKTVCGEGASVLVVRPKRTEDEDNPSIHYGRIASANRLMKDALTRDALAMRQSVLCFEMEAAGLMNHFPCLVIRGICDYADSHKNKDWQGYAAMTAAAYTKDLLRRLAPKRIEAEKKIIKFMSDIHSEILNTSKKADTIIYHQRTQREKAILDWLSPVDYGPQQSDYFSKRQRGTGQWFLGSIEFHTWLNTAGQTLFCPGIPGAGKTTISSIIINDLIMRHPKKQNVGIAYLYCNYRRHDEAKAKRLLESLLKQLALGRSPIPKTIEILYEQHSASRTRPSLDELSKALSFVAETYSRVFIVIDALDECPEMDNNRTNFFNELFSLRNKTGLNILATSRFIPDIEKRFQGCLSLEICASRDDVWNFLEEQMPQLPDFVNQDADIRREIKTKINDAVDGMFLLAKLYMDSLVGKRSPAAIRKVLGDLRERPKGPLDGPSALYNAYDKSMERIQHQKGDLPRDAIFILSWIVYAKRPITVPELQHALAVEIGTSKLDRDNIPTVDHMVRASAPLITVDEKSNIIRLVHYTTQQYFERAENTWLRNADTIIATTCLTYLSFDVFGSGPCPNDAQFKKRLRSNALYHYAARSWGHHVRGAPTTLKDAIDFLDSNAKVESSCQALMSGKTQYRHLSSQSFPRHMTGLHLAAYFGVDEVLSILFSRQDERSLDSHGRNPLSYAAEEGYASIVKLLLDRNKVDVNAVDIDFGRAPLSWAAVRGNTTVVKLLLNHGSVDVNLEDEIGRTPLSCAAGQGHMAIVELLLGTSNVDVNARDEEDRAPLFWAIENGHAAIVQLLLDIGEVEVDARDQYGYTPFSEAVVNGNDTIVKLLIDTGKIEIDAENQFGDTPLSLAIGGGHESIVRLLLDTGEVRVDTKDERGQTPLLWAVINRNEAIMKLILDAGGVDVEASDEDGFTPINWTIMTQNERAFELLFDTGKVHIDFKDKWHSQIPFHWAIRQGSSSRHGRVLRMDATHKEKNSE